jgi:hypothetical protein
MAPKGDCPDHYRPKITAREKDRFRYQDPTLSIWISQLWLSSFQLTTVAGAAIIAKTAVAPLERVKVEPSDVLVDFGQSKLMPSSSELVKIFPPDNMEQISRDDLLPGPSCQDSQNSDNAVATALHEGCFL